MMYNIDRRVYFVEFECISSSSKIIKLIWTSLVTQSNDAGKLESEYEFWKQVGKSFSI